MRVCALCGGDLGRLRILRQARTRGGLSYWTKILGWRCSSCGAEVVAERAG